MPNLSKAACLAVVLTAVVAGCSDAARDAAPGIGIGAVRASWTIDGRTDPALCETYGAATLRLVVFDLHDVVRASPLGRCEDLSLREPLRAGLYTAMATFLDESGQVTSATLRVDPFTIEGEETTEIHLSYTRELMVIGQKRTPGVQPR